MYKEKFVCGSHSTKIFKALFLLNCTKSKGGKSNRYCLFYLLVFSKFFGQSIQSRPFASSSTGNTSRAYSSMLRHPGHRLRASSTSGSETAPAGPVLGARGPARPPGEAG